jgi:hypothetical protein
MAGRPGTCGTIEERFWRYVLKSPESDGCWEWTGGHDAHGYGSMGTDRRHTSTVNRVAYRLLVGPIPDGMCVCHRCDNRNCVNPAHLFLGSRADNLHDMFAKGRGGGQFESGTHLGGDNTFSKYTEDQIREIRRLVASGVTQVEVARQFGMRQGYVSHIVRRKVWKHI